MKKNRFGQAKVLDTKELDTVISNLPSNKHKTLALLMRNCGCRVGEAVQLTWNDVEEESILFPKTIVKRKLKSREVFISQKFFNCLMKWKQELALLKGREIVQEDYIFPGRFEGSFLTPRGFQLALESALKAASIKGGSSHSFRRSMLTKLHKSGLALKIIQSLSGHSNLQTLSLYLDISDDDKKKAIALLA